MQDYFLFKQEAYMFLKHGGGYILSIIPCPNPAADPSSSDVHSLVTKTSWQYDLSYTVIVEGR
jgi:hypothetical protein